MTFLVLHVRPYAFDADDGRRIEGATVTYLDPSTPIEEGERGLPPLQLTMPSEVASQFPEAPGYYQIKFAHKRGKGGRPVLSVAGARMVAPVNFEAQKVVS